MELLRTLAYWTALLIVASFPPALLYWLLIHPLAAFWRRLGKVATFTLVGIVCVGAGVWIGFQHERFLAVHWGFHWALFVVGLALYGLAAQGERLIRRQLKFSVLAGAPELDAENPGGLLTEGVYARCRNPRYVNIVVALLGWSLMLNYPALYVLTLLCIPALYVIVLLEERELLSRFGEPYAAYCAEVPRFIPRLGSP